LNIYNTDNISKIKFDEDECPLCPKYSFISEPDGMDTFKEVDQIEVHFIS